MDHMCYRGGLYIGSNGRKIKIVLTLEWMSEMNERKYACQSVVEINNGKFKKDGEITSGLVVI